MSTLIVRQASKVWNSYLFQLHKNPWRTQALSTALIMGTGDFLAQTVFERKTFKTYEYIRTLRFTGCGLIVLGPMMHLWYSRLDIFIKGPLKSVTMKKVCLDQGFFMPSYLGVFVVIMSLLRGEEVKQIKDDMCRDYPPMLLSGYAIWPTVQVLNFAFCPGHSRVLLVNMVNLFWNIYLAWKSEENHHPQTTN